MKHDPARDASHLLVGEHADIREPSLFIVRMMNSHSLMALAGAALATSSSRLTAIKPSRWLCRVVDLEFIENGFGFGILLLFSQIIDLCFPPVPGFHLNELIENAFAHWPVAVVFRLDSEPLMSILGNIQSF